MTEPWGPPPACCAPSPAQRTALAKIYADVDAALAPVAAACRACGRCCHFQPGGIVLFASALEMAYLVSESGRVACGGVAAAYTCPYQDGLLCMARTARPLGCRTYFCDAEARAAGEAAYADAFRRIQAAAVGGIWWYGPAGLWLASLDGAGR